MAETGLTIARIFTIWDDVEREKGKWDFERYDWIYDSAERSGIFIANTLCAEDPPGWMGTAGFYHQWRDLSDPKLRPSSEAYIEKVVTRYRGHAAHGVWLLQNEPGFRGQEGTFVLQEFAHWLEKKYGSVENLNRSWYRPLKRFEDVPFPIEPRVGGWSDYPSLLDWRRFQCDHLADQQQWIHGQIDKYHRGALTHINPPGLTSNMPAGGRDVWRLKPTVHFLGASMHAAWHFTMFPREEFGLAFAFCCDVIRSASAPSPWWVTELQAGPTIFTGSRPLNPTAGEIERWLWDGIGNAARGIVFWLWHPRTEGNEAGEWALAGPSGESTARTSAAQNVARALKQYDSFFRSAQPQPARAAILYNQDTMLLAAIDGWRRPPDDAVPSLMGCYAALQQAHVPVDFLDVTSLESGGAARYRVLYLPFSYALSPKSVSAIRSFVREGGTVWADGLVGWKDHDGTTHRQPPGPLSDVFGFTLDDIDAACNPFSLSTGNDQAGELWRCLIPNNAARRLVTGPDGRPAAIEHPFGKGKAVYYGSAVSLAYFKRRDSTAAAWIAGPAKESCEGLPIQVLDGPPRVGFRALTGPDGCCVVLTNWDSACRVRLRLPQSVSSAREILSGRQAEMTVSGDGKITELTLDRGAVAVVLAR